MSHSILTMVTFQAYKRTASTITHVELANLLSQTLLNIHACLPIKWGGGGGGRKKRRDLGLL